VVVAGWDWGCWDGCCWVLGLICELVAAEEGGTPFVWGAATPGADMLKSSESYLN
jgi:hypothetical protein